MTGVSLSRYRQVLALPGVAPLLIFAVLARIPLTATAVVLTLHVVTTLGGGYAAAGLVSTAATVGVGLGGPWRGRAVDRAGLRRALAPSVVVSTVAWGLSPFASFGQLLVLAAAGGLFGLPVFTVVRQSLAVLVPPAQQRTAFSLDGIGIEVSFMTGPAAGVLVATQLSTRAALVALTAATLTAGLAVLLLNPPTRSASWPAGPPLEAPVAAPRLARPGWFTPALTAILAVAAGATVVLAGTDVAVVALLREHDAVRLTGLVFAGWGIGSMAGGLIYGGLRREVSPFGMLFALALLTVPVGLAPGPLMLMLTIVPAALLCAPVIAATAEGVSRLVPEAARGEAMGWHGSALQAGSAVGAPLAGVVMDAEGAWSGFAVAGCTGMVIAATGLLLVRTRRRGVRQPGAVAVRDDLERLIG
jgi:MFS family permease